MKKVSEEEFFHVNDVNYDSIRNDVDPKDMEVVVEDFMFSKGAERRYKLHHTSKGAYINYHKNRIYILENTY